MFGKAIRLPFTLLGTPVFLDWSFLVILGLMGWTIARQVVGFAHQFDVPRAEQLTQASWPFLLGLIAAIGLFLGVLLHELSHPTTARLYGVPVRRITLWFLGGVAEFDQLPRRGAAEAAVVLLLEAADGGLAVGDQLGEDLQFFGEVLAVSLHHRGEGAELLVAHELDRGAQGAAAQGGGRGGDARAAQGRATTRLQQLVDRLDGSIR